MSSSVCERLKPFADWLKATFSRRDVLFGLAMAAAVWGAMPTFWEAFTPPDFSRNWRQDCDLVLIHKGLVEHPRFRDTLEWWHGTWVGQVPFWRPLTSLLFWLEWKAFGWEFQDAWMLVHGLSHIAACGALFVFAEAFTGSSIVAALACWLFNGPAPRLPGGYLFTAGAWHALHFWKDSPDLWLVAIGAGSIAAALRKQPALAALGTVAGVAIKETGFVWAAAVVVALAVRRKWLWAIGLAAIYPVLTAIRWQAVGAGFIMGTNLHPLRRVVAATAGHPVMYLLTKPTPVFLAAAIACALLLPTKARWAIAAACVCAAAIAQAMWTSSGLALAAAALLDATTWRPVMLLAVWLFTAAAGLRRAPRTLAWATIFFLPLAAMPAIAPQVRPHAFYGAWAVEAIIKAVCGWELLQWLRRGLMST